jgi:hypothetical protein
MARELNHIDIGNNPELLEIVEQVRRTNQSIVLRHDREDVAILRPVWAGKKLRIPRGKPFTRDDPLWNLVGIGKSGLGDVSANKHKYLADAFADLHSK